MGIPPITISTAFRDINGFNPSSLAEHDRRCHIPTGDSEATMPLVPGLKPTLYWGYESPKL